MAQVLVLTENPANETDLYDKLQKLDFEILLSDKILNEFRQGREIREWFQVFSIVIISETICDKEAEKIARLVCQHNAVCLRKCIDQPDVIEKDMFRYFDDWILETDSLTQLRDILFWIKERKNYFEPDASKQAHTQHSSVILFIEKLSPISRRVFIALKEQEGTVISREDLSNMIWGETTKSTLCQLSTRVRKIRQAIFDSFGCEDAIITVWCNGYYLSSDFCKNVLLKK